MPEQFRLNCSISVDQNVPHPNDVVPRNLSVLSSSSDRSLVKSIMLSEACSMSRNRPESRSGSIISQQIGIWQTKAYFAAIYRLIALP